MPTVKKTNTIPRKILKSDFQKVEVEDQEAVEFNPENDFTAEVNEAAAKYLVDHDAFELIEEAKSSSKSTSKSTTNKSTASSSKQD